jgi:catechol 2,3-dioxygenase-like lactoylglutathione lyase family enzyme
MGSRLTEIVVDCRDPEAQAAFWAAALGYHVVCREDGQVEIGPWVREPPDLAERVRRAPGVPTLVFVAVPKGKTVKNRLHLDLRPVDGSHAEEVERLVALGAGVLTSVRARFPGWCWPTRKGTSSVFWDRLWTRPDRFVGALTVGGARAERGALICSAAAVQPRLACPEL